MGIELSLVIPTYNERDNIQPLLKKIETVLPGINWEVIFVDDDSKDGTAALVREISLTNPRIRCLQRIGRRGLSSASSEGMLSSSAPFLAVMDADMQHDETILPLMLEALKNQGLDIVVGSRYVKGGGTEGWSKTRLTISHAATKIGQLLIKTKLSDPLSGYFMLRSSFFREVAPHLNGKGFKILLDIFASSPLPVRFQEIPFHFRPRNAGESKLDTLVAWEYLVLLAEKFFGKLIPFRFIFFVGVGMIGAVLHFTILWLALKVLLLDFLSSQACATYVAMTMNFLLNNVFSYRDKRLKGLSFWKGLLTFYIACSLGAALNFVVADFLYNQNVFWWLSGLIGAMIGAIWNFAISTSFTWTNR